MNRKSFSNQVLGVDLREQTLTYRSVLKILVSSFVQSIFAQLVQIWIGFDVFRIKCKLIRFVGPTGRGHVHAIFYLVASIFAGIAHRSNIGQMIWIGYSSSSARCLPEGEIRSGMCCNSLVDFLDLWCEHNANQGNCTRLPQFAVHRD